MCWKSCICPCVTECRRLTYPHRRLKSSMWCFKLNVAGDFPCWYWPTIKFILRKAINTFLWFRPLRKPLIRFCKHVAVKFNEVERITFKFCLLHQGEFPNAVGCEEVQTHCGCHRICRNDWQLAFDPLRAMTLQLQYSRSCRGISV